MKPEKIGRYEIERELGRGGVAVVYQAHDPHFGRDVAIKVMQGRSLENQVARARFTREATTIARLNHSYIVHVHDFGDADGLPYLVMDYMKGGALTTRLQQGPLPLSQVVRIVRRIAAALDHAHAEGLIHRDLKPHNILLNEYGDAYLSDFGIVKELKTEGQALTVDAIVGTLAYMSPEQITGQEIDKRSDVYSLGVTIFEMLTGRLPFVADNIQEYFMAHTGEQVPDVCQFNPALPVACQLVIERAMAKKPEARYASAGELARDLVTALDLGRAWEVEPLVVAVEPPQTIPLTAAADSVSVLHAVGSVITGTSERVRQQIRRLPVWARWGVFSLAGLLLFLTLLQVLAAPDTSPVSPTLSPAATTAVAAVIATRPAAVASPSPDLPPPVAESVTVLVLSWGESAVWQAGEDIHRIPPDGVLTIRSDTPELLIQSNAAPMELMLPDRSKLFLDQATTIILLQTGLETATSTLVLEQGSLVIIPVGEGVVVRAPASEVMQAQITDGLMAVAYLPPGAQFDVDCLQGICTVSDANGLDEVMTAGERRYLDNGKFIVASARYELYMGLVNRVPTPTAVPIVTPTEELTGTPTLTPTMTPIAFGNDMGPERIEIGRSTRDVPIHVVRFGNGPLVFVLVGGLHAGFAPNSVALMEQVITFYTASPFALPRHVTLLVVPNLNPDSEPLPGELGGRLNANGVDLNRNWDCRWAKDATVLNQAVIGSGGSHALSEPETQALHDLILSQAPTAVLVWTAHNNRATASPGACLEKSLVSLSLARLYGQMSGYYFVDQPEVLANLNLTGDLVNWLDNERIPAIAIIYSGYEAIEWEQNLAGITAVLTHYTGPQTNPAFITPTVMLCPPADSRWAALYAQHQDTLGCATRAAATPQAVFQLFNGGMMVWRGDVDQVYVLYNDYTLARYSVATAVPVDTHPLLKGAFSYIWHTYTTVSSKLGQPQEMEQAMEAFVIQDFERGAIFYFANQARNYLLLTGQGRWQDSAE